jgi:solute carrier family 35 protein E3
MVVTPLLIVGSIAVSTVLILVNKQVMSVNGWKCPTFLTSFHFLLTYGLLHIMGSSGLFEIARAFPEAIAWQIGVFGVTSIVFMNFNLKTNSIGFYQLSKLCTIPYLVVYKYFALGVNTSFKVLSSLTILLIGLCMFTVNDVQFNLIGCIIAVIAVITTAHYQLMANLFQKKFAVNGTQLSHRVGLPQFVICFGAGLVIETHGSLSIFAQDFTLTQMVLIVISGLCAVVGNVIGFSLIGRAGPVTFQVVGHVKTMLIFIFGLLMFPSEGETRAQLMKKVLGLGVSMCGVVLYTIFEMQEKVREKLTAQEMVVLDEAEEVFDNVEFLDEDEGEE